MFVQYSDTKCKYQGKSASHVRIFDIFAIQLLAIWISWPGSIFKGDKDESTNAV